MVSGLVRESRSLPQVRPEEVGFSPARLAKIRPFFEKQIAENRLAGGIGLIARYGKIAYFETFGLADREAGKPMRRDAIVRIYSMTKAITGVAAMILYEEAQLALLDPVSNYLPEFRNMRVAVEKTDPVTGKTVLSHTVPAERDITILDLMQHTSGLNYVGPHDEKGNLVYEQIGLRLPPEVMDFSLDEMVKRLSQAPLVYQPGTIWDYSFSTDVLGRVVEVVSGQSLDDFFAERIFKPLGMIDTAFQVPGQERERLAALYEPNADGTIRRSTGAAQESYKTKPAVLLGGGGLISTAMDYARFTQMLANDGELEGERILSPKTVELMRSDTLGDLPRAGTLASLVRGYGFGLTFAVNRGPGEAASSVSSGEYRWGGAAGTSFWIDPQENMTGVFLMQTLWDRAKRVQFQQLAYSALVDTRK